MQKKIILILLLTACSIGYAEDSTENNPLPSDYNLPANNNLQPPPPVTPNVTYPEVGTDSSTSSYPDTNSNMNTVTTQTIGTTWDQQPKSNPLQLDKVPNPEPNAQSNEESGLEDTE